MARSSDSTLADVTVLCDLISNPTRLRLVLLLAVSERNVTSLCEELKLAQPIISHHLGLLRMNRLVVGKRNGTQVFYSLAPHAKSARGKLKISLPPFSLTVEGC